MLKWLRKYNTWILVIGGVLLMVAFLMPTTIQEFGKRRMSGPVLRLAGQKVSLDDYTQSVFQYESVKQLFAGSDLLERLAGVENADHWVMLTHEADSAGLVGGVEDGKDAIALIIRAIYAAQRGDPSGAEVFVQTNLPFITSRVPAVAAQTHLTTDQVYQALSQFRGIIRLRNAYFNAPRFSDRRLLQGVKKLADAATADVVFIPPERAITDQTPKPTEAEIQAHFDRFKDTAAADSELGIGYKLPARVKLSWLVLNKNDIGRVVTADPVEVEKRLLKMYPNGAPAGADGDTARTRIETDIKTENTDKAIKAMDQAVRGEFEKITRKLDADGEYRRLPDHWSAPELSAIANSAASHVGEVMHLTVPAPAVQVRSDWLDAQSLSALPGLSGAKLKRGTQERALSDVLLKAREITGPNDLVLQSGIPYGEPLIDAAGNRYYVLVLDARKPSPPDTLGEVRDQVVKNIQRMNAFETLKTQVDSYRAMAVDKGLDAVAKAPDGVTGPAAIPLNVQKDVRIDGFRIEPASPNLDIPEFRDAVRDAAGNLDPTADLSKVDPSVRTLVVPSAKGLGLIVAKITSITPMTFERFRSLQDGMVSTLSRNELSVTNGSEDPFSLDQMEKRLKVEYLNGREKPAAKPKPVAAKAAR